MAAALLGSRLPGVVVRSAGIAAAVGEPAAKDVAALLTQRGFDVSMHRAMQVTRSMCAEADLILVMSRAQVQTTHDLFPHTRGKVFLLSEGADVEDPFGQSAEHFAACFDVVDAATENWMTRIKSEWGVSSNASNRVSGNAYLASKCSTGQFEATEQR
jgi:protein-tyrosine phosphatase